MKRNVLLIWAVLLAAILTGCDRGNQGPAHEGQLTVVASGYVPYSLARQIGGDKIALSMLLPANAEPHSFEPTPGTLVAVNGADVVAYVSFRLEPWMKEVAAAASKKALLVETGKPFAKENDPHVWMGFNNVRKMAAALEAAFAQKDPQNAAYYAENLKAFNAEMDELSVAYAAAFAACKHRTVVHIGHLAFGRLAQDYNLNLQALGGASHDGEQSVRSLARLVKLIRRDKIKTIFTEESVSPQLAKTIARETGVNLLPLYTVEHVSKEEFDNNITYVQFMRMNLENLQRGLVCSR